VHKTA
jgi:4-coumarate--CoA ligase